MSHVIVIANQKGGVGKTTTAVNLGAALAIAEQRALLIDVDPQANATSSLSVRLREDEACVYDWMMEEAPADELIRETEFAGLRLIPSHIKLVGAEIELVERKEREFALRRALAQIRDQFDYVILDCPPSLGLLTLNGLTAADGVLAPIQAEYFALEGITQLLQTIRLVQKRLNPNLRIDGIVLTMYDPRLNLARQVQEELRKYFPKHTFHNVVNRNVRLAEAPSFGKPVMHFAVSSQGARDYLAVAEELMERTGRLAVEEVAEVG